MSEQIFAGFMPLTDSAILVAAREFGLARAEGIDLVLTRETSWANIRDRMAVGHFVAAHLLAPMPVASNLGLSPLSLPLIAPMALGLGGNAVTVSLDLWQRMRAAGASAGIDPGAAGAALKRVIDARRGDGLDPLQLAVVHPHSGHNFELRYWLRACGIDPERDVDIVIVPPPLIADALASKRIDGFCVGEPWNSVAVAAGSGRMATVKAAIWRSSPEKVLGVRADWADANPDLHARLIRALWHAAGFCSRPENRAAVAEVLARPEYLGLPAELVVRALTGKLYLDRDTVAAIDDFFIPFERAATFPWRSHAAWFYSQMVLSGQVEHTERNAAIAMQSYRPDLYRTALEPLGAAVPSANSKVEGALLEPTAVGSPTGKIILGPDGFFDGRVFDPDRLDDYIADRSASAKSR